MSTSRSVNEFGIVAEIVSLLHGIEEEEQLHILTTVMTWLKLRKSASSLTISPDVDRQTRPQVDIGFTDREDLSPKQFLLEKEPQTNSERIACLAYYLTHYRDTPQFKTVDLTKLNTDAAQPRIGNPADAGKNALRDGFLASASKASHRQLSAMGEQYVNALPDREAAQATRRRMTPRKSRRKKPSSPPRKKPS